MQSQDATATTSFGETISSLMSGGIDIDDVHRMLERHMEEGVNNKDVIDKLYPVEDTLKPKTSHREQELEMELRKVEARLKRATMTADEAKADADKQKAIVFQLKEENLRVATEKKNLEKSIKLAANADGAKNDLAGELRKTYEDLRAKYMNLKKKYAIDLERFKRYQAKKKSEIQLLSQKLTKSLKTLQLGEQEMMAAKEVKQEFFQLRQRLRDAEMALGEARAEVQASDKYRSERDANYAALTLVRSQYVELSQQMEVLKARKSDFEHRRDNKRNDDEVPKHHGDNSGCIGGEIKGGRTDAQRESKREHNLPHSLISRHQNKRRHQVQKQQQQEQKAEDGSATASSFYDLKTRSHVRPVASSTRDSKKAKTNNGGLGKTDRSTAVLTPSSLSRRELKTVEFFLRSEAFRAEARQAFLAAVAEGDQQPLEVSRDNRRQHHPRGIRLGEGVLPVAEFMKAVAPLLVIIVARLPELAPILSDSSRSVTDIEVGKLLRSFEGRDTLSISEGLFLTLSREYIRMCCLSLYVEEWQQVLSCCSNQVDSNEEHLTAESEGGGLYKANKIVRRRHPSARRNALSMKVDLIHPAKLPVEALTLRLDIDYNTRIMSEKDADVNPRFQDLHTIRKPNMEAAVVEPQLPPTEDTSIPSQDIHEKRVFGFEHRLGVYLLDDRKRKVLFASGMFIVEEDLDSGEQIFNKCESRVCCFAISNDENNRTLVAAGTSACILDGTTPCDASIVVFNRKNGCILRCAKAHKSEVASRRIGRSEGLIRRVKWSPNSRRFFTIGERHLEEWEVEEEHHHLRKMEIEVNSSSKLSPFPSLLCCTHDADGSLWVGCRGVFGDAYRVKDGRALGKQILHNGGSVTCICKYQDGFISAGEIGGICVVDGKGQIIRSIKLPEEGVVSLSVLNESVVITTMSGSVYFVETLCQIRSLESLFPIMQANPDGVAEMDVFFLKSRSEAGEGKEEKEEEEGEKELRGRIITAGSNGSFVMFELNNSKRITRTTLSRRMMMICHDFQGLGAVRFSPDGKQIAVGHKEGVSILDASSLEVLVHIELEKNFPEKDRNRKDSEDDEEDRGDSSQQARITRKTWKMVTCLAYSPQGGGGLTSSSTLLAVGTAAGVVHIIDCSSSSSSSSSSRKSSEGKTTLLSSIQSNMYSVRHIDFGVASITPSSLTRSKGSLKHNDGAKRRGGSASDFQHAIIRTADTGNQISYISIDTHTCRQRLLSPSSSSFKEHLEKIKWLGYSCPFVWGTQGCGGPTHQHQLELECVAASSSSSSSSSSSYSSNSSADDNTNSLVVMGDSFGAISLFRFPCLRNDNGHRRKRAHCGGVKDLRFLNRSVVSLGGDGTVLLWELQTPPDKYRKYSWEEEEASDKNAKEKYKKARLKRMKSKLSPSTKSKQRQEEFVFLADKKHQSSTQVLTLSLLINHADKLTREAVFVQKCRLQFRKTDRQFLGRIPVSCAKDIVRQIWNDFRAEHKDFATCYSAEISDIIFDAARALEDDEQNLYDGSCMVEGEFDEEGLINFARGTIVRNTAEMFQDPGIQDIHVGGQHHLSRNSPSYLHSRFRNGIEAAGEIPRLDLKLEWAYGYNSSSSYGSNLYFDPFGRAIYPAAGVVVAFDVEHHHQSHYIAGEEVVCMCKAHHDPSLFAIATTKGGGGGGGETEITVDIHIVSSSSIGGKALLPKFVILKGAHKGGVATMGFSADGNLLASVDSKPPYKIKLWAWKEGLQVVYKESKRVGGNSDEKTMFPIYDLQWHMRNNNEFVVVGKKYVVFYSVVRDEDDDSRTITLKSSSSSSVPTNYSTTAAAGIIRCEKTFICCTYMENGAVAVATKGEGSIHVFRNFSFETTIKAHRGTVLSLTQWKEGIISGGMDGKLITWKLKQDGAKTKLLPIASMETRYAIKSIDAFEEKLLIGTSSSHIFHLTNWLRAREQKTMQPSMLFHEIDVLAVGIVGNSNVAITIGSDNSIRSWDLNTKLQLQKGSLSDYPGLQLREGFESPSASATCLAVHPEELYLALGTRAGTILIFDLDTFEIIRGRDLGPIGSTDNQRRNLLLPAITCVQYSPMGDVLVVGTEHGSIILCDVPEKYSPKCVLLPFPPPCKKHVHRCFISKMDWSEDGRFVRILNGEGSISAIRVEPSNLGRSSSSSLILDDSIVVGQGCTSVKWSSQHCVVDRLKIPSSSDQSRS
eukprot:jgi/Bigna1/137551/aug1.40_g12259